MIFYLAILAYCIGTLVSQLRALRTIPNPRAVAAMQQAWYYWMQQQQYGEGYGYGQQGDAGESAYPPAPPAGSPDQQNLPPPPSA